MKNFAVLHMGQFDSGNEINGFHSNTVENHIVTAHKNIHKPHKHSFYLTVLFTHGSGTHEVDFVTYGIRPGCLFFLNPGQMHHWELSEDIKGFVFFHSQPFYDLHFATGRVTHFPFFHSIQNPPVLYLQKDEVGYFSSLFQQIYKENHLAGVFRMKKILALIELVYIESTRLYVNAESMETVKLNAYSDKFQQLEHLIETHYKSEKLPSKYAEWLYVSPKHLNRITQNMVNKTTTDIILERVFLEAKRELITQKFSFSEIAADLGYVDYAYFSRLFKKKCGETPSEFLQRYR